MVACVFQTGRNWIFMGLEVGIRKTTDKPHGEIREGVCQKDAFEKGKVRDCIIVQEPKPVLLV